jgi:hypothetical protein
MIDVLLKNIEAPYEIKYVIKKKLVVHQYVYANMYISSKICFHLQRKIIRV